MSPRGTVVTAEWKGLARYKRQRLQFEEQQKSLADLWYRRKTARVIVNDLSVLDHDCCLEVRMP
jgi:hypothetical protein